MIRQRLDELLATIDGVQIVGHAEDADAAIAEILDTRPDAVVLDLKLTRGTGFDVLRAVHRDAPAIDVYMLTNHATEPYRRVAMDLGARGFFDKSTEMDRIRDALAACAVRH